MRLQDRPWRADCLTRWLTTVGSEPRRCREVRWFVDGEISDELRPTRRPVKRADLYELETLRPWEAHKCRGGSGVMEHKLRVGRVELIEWGGGRRVRRGVGEVAQRQAATDRSVSRG